ncbi:MAG: SPOR domain-containing protein [Gammaproteobacteria bacterium]|nr:SPOR domain-containing protein [Gammaproteobacteria bacterium]
MSLDQTIKQRLIGAIVLVAIAVVFLPGILGQKKQQQEFSTKIPVQPQVIDSKDNSSSRQEINIPVLNNDSEENGSEESDSEDNQSKPSNGQSTTTKDSDTDNQSIENTTKPTKKSASESNADKLAQSSSENAKKEPVKTTSEQNKPSKSNSTKPQVEPSKDVILKNDAYVVQVGSFSSHGNADILSKRLEEEQLKAFVRPFKKDDGQVLYRVYVGPWLNKESAEKQVEKIADITRLSPIVIKWDATRH